MKSSGFTLKIFKKTPLNQFLEVVFYFKENTENENSLNSFQKNLILKISLPK